MRRAIVLLLCLVALGAPAAPAGAVSKHAGYTLTFGSARWDPCHVIGYRVDEHRMPQGGRGAVHRALRQVADATGLRFRYAGRTSQVPYSRHATSYPHDTDLVIAWTTAAVVPGLGGAAAGLGGAQAGPVGASGWRPLGEGGVALDTAAYLGSNPRGVRRNRGILLLHELGHVMGLGHTTDPHEIMHSGFYGSTTYGPGDLRGLAALGADNGCI